MVRTQGSGQHRLGKEEDVTVDGFADPEIWDLLLTWLKMELNQCLGPEGGRVRVTDLDCVICHKFRGTGKGLLLPIYR